MAPCAWTISRGGRKQRALGLVTARGLFRLSGFLSGLRFRRLGGDRCAELRNRRALVKVVDICRDFWAALFGSRGAQQAAHGRRVWITCCRRRPSRLVSRRV